MAQVVGLYLLLLMCIIQLLNSTAALSNGSDTESNNSCTATVSAGENVICDNGTKILEMPVDSAEKESNATETPEISNITLTTECEDEDSNSTHQITEPAPASPEVSSVQPSSTPEETTLTTSEVSYSRKISEDICTCDLTMNSCDINCCCDSDCSEADRRAFSICHVRTPYIFDQRHCYQTHFIYYNNTELKFVRNNEDLFCIVRDNLPKRFLYQNRKVIVTLKDFHRQQEYRRTFSWPIRSRVRPLFNPSKSYTAGNILWIIRNTSIIPFSLPVKATSFLCQAVKNMQYLTYWSGSCSRILTEELSQDCESYPAFTGTTYTQEFSFLASPLFINESFTEPFTEECPSSICVFPRAYLCQESEINAGSTNGCKEVEELQKTVYNSTSRSCTNVVKQVKYVIFHNGTEGILKVNVYIWLTNITKLQKEFSQNFAVSFQWARNIGTPFCRSGNPGYIIGKPVMSGRKVVQPAEEDGETETESIKMSRNPNEWLSVAAALNNGQCDLIGRDGKYYRQSVTFKENRLSSCSFPIRPSDFTSSTACSALFNKVIMLLVGNAIENVTAPKMFNMYVATFGDSKPEDTEDWVQVMLETIPSFVPSSSNQKDSWSLVCKGIITRMHIDILFAYVGSITSPQAKILGVKYKFGMLQDITFYCTSLHCVQDEDTEQYFKVVTSINFVDVTKPAITEFAEPPVYEVKLPHDFFYPFFSKAYVVIPNILFVIIHTTLHLIIANL